MTRLRRWGTARSMARAPVVGALCLVVMVVAGGFSGIVGYADLSARTALRSYLQALDSRDVVFQLQTRLGDARQSEVAEEQFADTFSGISLTITRSVSAGVETATAGSQSQELELAAFPEFLEHARVVDGDWPARDAPPADVHPTALSKAAATALGVRVGDTLELDSGRYLVSALWVPRLVDDEFFFSPLASQTGGSTAGSNQLIVGEEALASLYPFVRWTITPDDQRFAPGEIPPLTQALARAEEDFAAAPGLATRGTLSDGGLERTMSTLESSRAAALAILPISFSVLLTIGLLVMAQLAGLITRLRHEETELARARGATSRQMSTPVVAEAAFVSVVGALLGCAVAVGVLTLTVGAMPARGYFCAAAAAALSFLVIQFPGVLQAYRREDERKLDSGRGRVFAAFAILLVLALGAAITTWRFMYLGGTSGRGAGGAKQIDFVAVLAPSVDLLLGSVLVGGLFIAMARLGERVVIGRRDLPIVLGIRQTARRGTTYGVLVTLVAAGVAATTLAATYATTQERALLRADAMTNGPELRVDLPSVDPLLPTSASEGLLAGVRELDSIRTAMPVQDRMVQLGQSDARLLAVSADELSSLIPTAIRDVGGELLVTETEPEGLTIPPDTRALDLTFEVSPELLTAGPQGDAQLDVTVWIQEPDGSLQTLQGEGFSVSTGVDAATTATVSLPQLRPSSRLVAIDTAVSTELPLELSVRLSDVTATGPSTSEVLPLESAGEWQVLVGAAGPLPATSAGPGDVGEFEELGSGVGWRGAFGPNPLTQVRLVAGSESALLPVVLDRDLADNLSLTLDDRIAIGIDAARVVPARVVSVVEHVPGSGGEASLGTDLGSYSRAMLNSFYRLPSDNGIWASPGSVQAAETIRPLLPPESLVTRAADRSVTSVVASATTALWLGAMCTLLLAVAGTGCVVAGVSTSRRGELVVLQAVGVSARTQSRSRGAELFTVVVSAIFLGLIVGAAVSVLTVPGLARSTLPVWSGDALALGVDGNTLGWLLLAFIGIEIGVTITLVLRTLHELRPPKLSGEPR